MAPMASQAPVAKQSTQRSMSVWLSPDAQTANMFHLSVRFPDGSILPCSFSMTKNECCSFLQSVDKETSRYNEMVAAGTEGNSECPTFNLGCMSWCRGQICMNLSPSCCCKMSRLGSKICYKKMSMMCHDWCESGKLKEKY